MKQNKWNYQQKGKLNYYRDGGITINPKNEGKFTDFAKSIGMDVQAAAAHVLAHRDKYSPMRVKQANFARNAAKFKHAANGGEMNMPAMPGGFHYAMPPALALRLTGMHNTACPDCEGYLPQEQFGGMSTEGYRSNSPDRFNSYNIIPSGNISMQNVPHPVMGIDNTGMQQMMYPGANYQFPGQAVFEMPVRGIEYQQGGEPSYLPPQGYTPSTPQERMNWNRFLDYLQSKGVAGSKDLDMRDKNLGLNYLTEYNKANPDAQVPEAFIPRAQYENYQIRKQNTFPGLPRSEAEYAFTGLSAPFKERPISAVDNWLGSYTSQEYYPRFSRGTSLQKADGTKQSDSYDFGTDFQAYVQSLNNPELGESFRVKPTGTLTSKRMGGQYGRTKNKKNTNKVNNYYQQGGGYNPFSFDPNIASTFLAGQNPGFVNYMNQNAIASKTNSTPWGVNPPPRPLINPDMGATYLAGQDPGLSKFLERKKIASKDNQNPSGVNDSYGPDPEPKTTTKTYRTANPMLAGASVAGLSFFNNALEANDRNRYNYLQRLRGMSDSFGPVAPGSRGDYSLNEGYFRPNQNVPVQFGAMPMAQTGGVFDNPMTNVQQLEMPTEINQYAGMPTAGAQYANMPGGGEDMPTAPTSAKNQSNAIVPTANTKDVRLNEKARKAYSYYVNEKDLPAQVAAGIVGNLFWESGLKTDAKEQGHTEAGRGIAQWDVDGRWQGFQNWAKKNDRKVNDLYAQLDYVLTEPGEGTKALKALMKARTPEEAAYVFGKTYERPLDKKDVAQAKNPARWDMRAGIARQLYNESQPANEAANGAGNSTGMYAAAGQPAYTSETEAQASYQQGGIFQNNYLPFPQRYQRGGEYMVTPDQVRYILAHGGEIEFI